MFPTALIAVFPFLSTALANHNALRRSHGHTEARDNYLREMQELEERLMPITATTTIMVQQTMTQTVWVEPTGQVVFQPDTSTTDPVESTSTASSSIGVESAVSSSEDSVVSTTSASDSTSSGSSAPRPSRASGSGPPRSSPQPTSMPSSSASVTDDSISSTASDSSISASAAPSSSSSTSSSDEWASSSSSDIASYTSSAPIASETDSSLAQSSITDYGASSSSWNTETLWASSTSTSFIASASASASIPASAASSFSYAPSSSAAAPSASATSNSNLLPVPDTVMCGYYPDWSGWYLTPENVDWSKFDVMDFAFALPTADGGLQFTQDDSSDLLHRLVKTGHAAGKRVKLSIGGWTGSAYFSTICADSNLRATFVSNIAKAYAAYNVDGIDIDWEYPGVSGASGNAVSSADSANLLLLFQDMRAALPSEALLTSATQVWPYADANGNPMSDVSAFASVIDWILIMNYDIWGSSSTPGPNAPLSNACHNSTQPLANAYAAISSWTTAGMPAKQITLGVPAYGYLQSSWATSLVQRRSSFPQPPHKRSLGSPVEPRGGVTVNNGNGGTSDGQVMFESLISQGALTPDGQGGYVGAGGFVREWDSCSSTPWLKSDETGQIVTYDDPESMSLKGQFAAQAGIKGCNVFSVDGDWTGSSWPLTDAVRSGLGI